MTVYRAYVCGDPEPPPGMVCAVGPEGCGMCMARPACNLPIPAGTQDWTHCDDGPPDGP